MSVKMGIAKNAHVLTVQVTAVIKWVITNRHM